MSNPIPCFLEFTEEAVEDREASIKAGNTVYKNMHYVMITPPGGRDTVQKVALEWLADKRRQGDAFYKHYQSTYEAWQSGVEAPVSGLALRLWPACNPSEVKSCLQANIRTVEEMAQADAGALLRIGPGAQSLKNRAILWVDHRDRSSLVQEVNRLREDLTAATALIAEMVEQSRAAKTGAKQVAKTGAKQAVTEE